MALQLHLMQQACVPAPEAHQPPKRSSVTAAGLQGVPGQGLSDSVRRYRQTVFKLNYKIKKRRGDAAAEAGEACLEADPVCKLPIIPSTAAAKVAALQSPTPGGAPTLSACPALAGVQACRRATC